MYAQNTILEKLLVYVCEKKSSQDQIPPCHTVILLAGYSLRKGPFKIQGTKMEGSGENRHYPENPVSGLTVQNSFSSSFNLFNSPVLSDTSSPPLGRSRTTWRRMEENAPRSITERPHSYMLSYLDSMYVVLQGWERSTSASLVKDAKTLQVRH